MGRLRFGALVVLAVGLAGCVTVGAETPAEHDPRLVEVAERNPVLADLDGLESGERNEYKLIEASSDIFGNEYAAQHIQRYVPRPGYSLEDIVFEIIEEAVEQGYEMEIYRDGRTYCGLSYDADGGVVGRLDLFTVETAGTRSPPHVALHLLKTGCPGYDDPSWGPIG